MSEVDFRTEGPVAVITINRPHRRNALNSTASTQLFAAWEQFENTPSLKVAILTGAGDKAFCAGMDLKEAAETGAGLAGGKLPILGDNVHVTKPVIAAVNGVAVAGGWLLAQMCDLCIAAQSASFGITEAKVGRGMPWAAPLAKMLPQRIVMELLLTGDLITADRAYEIGFVNRVVPLGDLLDTAMQMAQRIAANAPLTVTAAKELVYMSTEMGRSASIRAAAHLFERVYQSNDALEGPKAFAEKREPKWAGR